MPGYAFLPTTEKPLSTTLRLSRSDMKERNKWIIDARERGMSVEEIAHEVGLSVPYTYQIIKKHKQTSVCKKNAVGGYSKAPKTPRDAALADFYKNGLCRCCMKDGFASCNNCFGQRMIVESCYDVDGWPDVDGLFDEFVMPHMQRPTSPRWLVTWYSLNGEAHVWRHDSEEGAMQAAEQHKRNIPESVLAVSVEKGRYPGANLSGIEVHNQTRFI